MTSEPRLDAHEDRLQEAISLYLEALERKQTPKLAEYLARYPDCEAELTAFDAAHRRVHGIFADFIGSPSAGDAKATAAASQATVPWVRVATPTDTTTPTTEVREELRNRLRALALLMAVGIGVMRGIGLAFAYPSLAADPLSAFTQPPCYGNAALLVCLEVVIIVLLSPRRATSMARLRTLELLGFALPALAVAWNDTLDLAELAPAIDGRFGLTVAYAKSLTWVLFMVVYGVLIPNTWQRCAAVVSLFALLGLLPDMVVLLRHDVATGSLAVYLANKIFWISLAALVVIYGARRLEVLRHEANAARRLGQYLLKGRLGAGGMGEVYLAEHVLLRRPCALKLIHPDRAVDPKSLLRFQREVRAMATLTHPNTVQIFDYGFTDNGTFYYVMEYLPGLTLDQLVKQHGPVPPERAIYFLRQICRALREAHAIGLIHRDVKPGNILVCQRGGQHDVAKLLDFGLVLVQSTSPDEPSLTAEHAVAGSPHYMSPEQAAGRDDVDHRADIYGLAAVAYFLLTGRPPFAGRTVGQVLAAHQYELPEPLTGYRPELPAELEAAVLRSLSKAPAERFPDTLALERALADCPTAQTWGEEEAAAWWRLR